MEFEDKPKKRRRTSAEVQSANALNDLTMGLVAIMDEVLCVDYISMGSEGYVSGTHECAERIAKLIMNGINAAGAKSERQQEALTALVAHAWDAEPKKR